VSHLHLCDGAFMSVLSTGFSRNERRGGSDGGVGGCSGPDRVRSLRETAALLNISIATLRRMIAAGTGPKVIRLSPRRVGVLDGARERFLQENAT
jgi:predicted DNA-binding transcriptional regulator AlpA